MGRMGIVNDTDFMTTHTYVADDNMGKSVPHVRLYGDTEAIVLSRMGHKFRILDDDGNVYFEGYSGDDSSFEPLDSLGASYGATILQYRDEVNGGWASL